MWFHTDYQENENGALHVKKVADHWPRLYSLYIHHNVLLDVQTVNTPKVYAM